MLLLAHHVQQVPVEALHQVLRVLPGARMRIPPGQASKGPLTQLFNNAAAAHSSAAPSAIPMAIPDGLNWLLTSPLRPPRPHSSKSDCHPLGPYVPQGDVLCDPGIEMATPCHSLGEMLTAFQCGQPCMQTHFTATDRHSHSL